VGVPPLLQGEEGVSRVGEVGRVVPQVKASREGVAGVAMGRGLVVGSRGVGVDLQDSRHHHHHHHPDSSRRRLRFSGRHYHKPS
jgi:hypothetical protein